MPKKLTREEFIERANEVHKGKYDYSKVVYVNNRTKVCIICPEHGIYLQQPDHHLAGRRCPKCGYNSNKTLIYGVAVNDMHNTKGTESYKTWFRMLTRCYNPISLGKEPAYIGCSVCDEWLLFSQFKKWFDENHLPGYDLDKDIIHKGNKEYSPQSCCFVPAKINNLIKLNKGLRGIYPLGVSKSRDGLYRAQFAFDKKKIWLGDYSTAEEAFAVYKEKRESYVKEIAAKYYSDGKITKRVFDALMLWEINITD